MISAEKIAFKIVPTSYLPTKTKLRKDIQQAIIDARNTHYPEVREALANEIKELRLAQANLEKRELLCTKRESELKDLIIAVLKYEAWMDGDGEITENSKRFNELRKACSNFIKKVK